MPGLGAWYQWELSAGTDFGLLGTFMDTERNESLPAALEAKPAVTSGFQINLVTAVGGQAPKAGSVSPAWFHDGTGGQHQQCCWEPLVLLLPGHQLSMGGLVA